MKYLLTLIQSEEGYAAWCDDLPACNSQGQTREEAVTNIKGTISEYRRGATGDPRTVRRHIEPKK